MDIMHNKLEKFITQLRHATHGERRIAQRREVSKYHQPA